ncbi:hypothetical protein ACFSTC_52885 [Nonomuraea ferruginea]
MADPGIPAEVKDPANWTDNARREWGDDGGATGAAEHREALIKGFEQVRAAIDDFNPDAVLIWGDDQYENFHEDLIPPYAVLAYPDLELRPWAQARLLGGHAGQAERVGRTVQHHLPGARLARHRPASRLRAAGTRRRRGLRLQAGAPSGAAARVPQRRPLPGLPPHRLRLPGHPVPDQLLRPQGSSATAAS